NPMYLGLVLLLVGYVIYLSNLFAFLAPIGFVSSMTILQIKPEERALREKFGPEYDAYCQRTRRWI
ncbi:MAG: isoprenylcysteine carboxylmethyltransferase family protein, partial [Pseudomonadota bacterium]